MEVEVWEDLVCPWCFIGRHRLQRAINAFEHPTAVSVRARPFELAPRQPVGTGLTVRRWLESRGVSPQQADAKLAAATAAGREEGLEFDMDSAVAANTFDGHRLVELAWRTGGSPLQSAVVERLCYAHFIEGLPIDDPETLFHLGSEAGLEPTRLPGFISGDELADEVRAGERVAADLGVTAVPCFVVGRRLAVPGAASVEDLLALIRRGYEEVARD